MEGVAEPVVDKLSDDDCDAEDDTDAVELALRVPAMTLPLITDVTLTDGVAVGVRLPTFETEAVPELVEDRSADDDTEEQLETVLEAVLVPGVDCVGDEEPEPVKAPTLCEVEALAVPPIAGLLDCLEEAVEVMLDATDPEADKLPE